MSKECQEIRKDLDAFVDREVEQERQSVFESHLSRCKPCLRLYQLISGVKVRLQRSAAKPITPPHLKMKVLAALEQESTPARSRWDWGRWLVWLPAPAVVAAVLLVGLLSLTGSRTSDAYDFTDISLQAWYRLENDQLSPQQPDTFLYKVGYRMSKLPERPAPSLEELGWDCVGCCFGLSVEHPVAHYVYQKEDANPVSLVMWKRETPNDKIIGDLRSYQQRDYYVSDRDGVRLVLWEEDDVFYSVFGNLELDHLLPLADAVRLQV